jgi:hypothetical protein
MRRLRDRTDYDGHIRQTLNRHAQQVLASAEPHATGHLDFGAKGILVTRVNLCCRERERERNWDLAMTRTDRLFGDCDGRSIGTRSVFETNAHRGILRKPKSLTISHVAIDVGGFQLTRNSHLRTQENRARGQYVCGPYNEE